MNVIPLRPVRSAPPPPTAAEIDALERAVRDAHNEARAARKPLKYALAVVRYRALREELAQVRGRGLAAGEVA